MTEVLQALQYATSLVFVLLGLLTLRDYLLHRERSRGFLALAMAKYFHDTDQAAQVVDS